MSYSALLTALLQSAFIQPADAADLSVGNTTARGTPITTADANNGPGNVTLELGSTVSIATSGAVVTLNSNNQVTQVGLVENSVISGGIGVNVRGGFIGNYTLVGASGAIINITGNGTGNYGVLVGNATTLDPAFQGNITLNVGSTIRVFGENVVGVAIKAPINTFFDGNTTTGGDLLAGSFITATGVGATGILVKQDIAGMLTVAGTVSVAGTQNYTVDKQDPEPGSAIAIGSNIGKGVLITGLSGSNDSGSTTANVISSASAPAIFIAPSIGGNVGNITLNTLVNDVAGLNYSLINRGVIRNTQNDTGISTIGVQIGDVGGNYSVSLPNGFYNRGQIVASSESDNKFATSVTAVPTNATGVIIGNATANPFSSTQAIGNSSWTTAIGNGSTAVSVVLDATHASTVDGIYNGLTVTIGSESHVITGYDGATKTISVAGTDPFLSTPTVGGNVTIGLPDQSYVALGGNASGISGAYNNLKLTVSGDASGAHVITNYTVIYDPCPTITSGNCTAAAPVLRIAKIGALLPGETTTLAGPVALDTPVSITGSALVNDGTIAASMAGTAGGNVTALLIHADGNVASLTNNGVIQATATTTNTTISTLSAIAINDLSGNLTTIINTRTIATGATTLTGNATSSAVAVDISHAITDEKVYVLGRGIIEGDVKLGSGNNTLTIEGDIPSTFANVTTQHPATVMGNISSAGAGTLEMLVSGNGTGGVLRTLNTQATNITVGDSGAVEFTLTKGAADGPPLIATTGTVSFAAGTTTPSTFVVSPTTFLPISGNYTLITTGSSTGLHFVNFGATSGLANDQNPFPFLVTATFKDENGNVLDGNLSDVKAQTLKVEIQRKTASMLGLPGNSAAIFEPLAEAALNDDAFGAALLKLTNAQEVQAAVASTVPDIAGGVRALTVAMTDQATGVIGSRQRALLTAPEGSRTDFRFWGQEFYNIVSDHGTALDPGFGGAGQGLALGGEWGSLRTGRYGVGYTFFSSQETERHPRDTKTNGDWNLISAYAAWKFGDFFVAPQVNAGMGDLKSRRSIVVGNQLFRSATAKWQSYLGAGGATAGYIVDLGNFQIIPTIAVDALYLSESAYSEVGGGGVGLSLKSQNETSVRSFAGVIGQGSYRFNEGAFMPQLLAGWSHEFMNDPATIDGSFESMPGSPFHLVGPTLDANKVVGGMSFGYVLRNWSAGFNYDATASSGSLAQSATISLSSRF